MGKITERLMTVGHSGEVLLWDPEGQNHKKLAELAYTRTPHKDVYCTRLNTGQDEAEHNFLRRQYICHTIELHPTDPRTYYITTNEGSILTCKTREVLGDMEILPAHCGPVLGMKHSPFTSLVFLSHGTDFTTKIWVKGINEPVITLRTTLLSAILCALWSPSHSSCLVILSKEEFSLWDISRSILDPMNREERSEEAYFTTAAFIKNGTSLHVGMSDGTVTTYRLNDMPHPPYLQINHLHGAFTKMLSENKALLKQIDDILGQVSKDN
ncbi:WD repeat-containing protein 78-like [Cimex lectularius]|uniref:Uncharacterized protein n=1 Tax=Cimex lectularius TaxID=79782 RepID=A0A8I6TLH2_CIMLE|nr:WD repeat-containing protein 78-like [Cimex lectularius]